MKSRTLALLVAVAAIADLGITASIASAQARTESAYLLVARNDRVPDTKPSYVYAGRHMRVAVVAGRAACRRAGNALVDAGYRNETGATRFACLKRDLPIGKRYPAADLFGYEG